MRLEVRVLGDVQVDIDGRPVDVGHARQRCVLAGLLVDTGRPVPLDQLMSRVWGDRQPQRARGAMYTYLSRLRQTFAVAGVTIDRHRGGYLLTVPPEAVDLHRFDRLVRQARTAGTEVAALELWEQALALWQGIAFAGLDTPWLATVRADLDRRRLAAELDRNELALRLGRHGRLLAELSAAAGRHPLDERLAGQLMIALYRCGRQSDALTHYDRTRRLLAEELGTDPSRPLRRLHHQILTNHCTLDTPPPADVAAMALPGGTSAPDIGDGSPPPTQLPADVSAFTGRTAELSRLDALLDVARRDGTTPGEAGAVVISAVSGTAGVGKTSLAVRWTHRIRDRFPDGQLYVNLRGYDPRQPVAPADALAGFLYALGVRGQDIPLDLDGRAALFRTEVAGRRMLVLLDNAKSVEQVRPLLPGTNTCLVVVTSRDSLAGLVAVHGARRLDLDVLPAGDAVALLGTLVGERVDAEPDAAVALAGLCAGLPLALRIVAEHVVSRPALGLADLAEELTSRRRPLDLLDGGDPHACVRSVFSWSYRHLPADTARVFRLLGLHPAATIDDLAVAALTGIDLPHTRKLLLDLTRAHLVQPAGARRFSMHDLLRAYAMERASDDDPADNRHALTRLFDHYLAAIGAATAALSSDLRTPPDGVVPAPPDPAGARAWLDAERANLTVVCAYMTQYGWDRHTVAFARALADYLEAGGHSVDALSIYDHARDAARRINDRSAESLLLWELGSVHWIRGGTAQGVDYFRESLALCRDLGDRAGEARALRGLGAAHQWMGRHDQAGDYLLRALALLRELCSPEEVFALRALGNLYGRQGRHTPARDHLHAALASSRRHGFRQAEIYALHDLAMLTAWHGPFDEASEYAEQALALSRRIHHAGGETMALTGLGVVCTRQGRFGQAARHLRQALARCRQMGFGIEEVRVRYNLGIVYERQGHLGPAVRHLEWALSRYGQTGERPGVADALHALGVADTKDGRPEQAADRHRAAIAIFRQLDHPAGEALALNGLGEALHAAGHVGQAQAEHAAALVVAIRIEDRHEQARAHCGLARACLANGEPEQARHHWEIALDRYAALRSPEATTVRTQLAVVPAGQ